MQTPAPQERALERRTSPVQESVAALALRTSRELEAQFASARVEAADFRAIAGDPRGRVLAVPGIDAGPVGALVRSWHGSALYPWEGKSFTAVSDREGHGVNRFRLPLRRGWFRFRTALGSSRLDGGPVISIDYDVPENPRLARGIYDELRSVGGGLYLGRGMLRTGASLHLLLWFLVDTRSHDLPLP